MSKLIVFAGPSGVGKSTITRFLLEKFSRLKFSISATTREIRKGEVDGRDYYFLTVEDFLKKIDNNEFIEWEKVYEGKYYGTLKSEVDRILRSGNVPIFDIDYKGALSIKKTYCDKAKIILVRPPSIEVLRERLINRGTETMEGLSERIKKFEEELSRENEFDLVLVNDKLEETKEKAWQITCDFITNFS